jgi:sterol 24-C-methyltransferase
MIKSLGYYGELPANWPLRPRHEKLNMLPSQNSKPLEDSNSFLHANSPSSYYNLGTDLYEYGWGQSFHFCRFAYGEPFYQAVARHEHYLAAKIGIKDGDKVLDVGCGVGGPAREIAKFTGAHITGLNNNDYQIDRATRYAQKEGLADQLTYVKGDFMVRPPAFIHTCFC